MPQQTASQALLKLFKEKEALLEGHFELASGKHSAFYLQCARLLQYPDIAHSLCQRLALRFSAKEVDGVMGPAMGGIIIAYEMGRILGKRAIYAERKEAALELRRFEIKKGERILLVEDVVTTGGSILELAHLCENLGAHVLGFATWVDRTGGKIEWPFRLEALIHADFPTYDRSKCPLCQEGKPVTKPGSQRIKK
ncbi:MAG: orotate phosphoribosyltransferase [Chlamydiae bacterium]|nr:orotate phosphoribosyltransferase [Chlamydiota bacterium]MBI3266106.1 orotate phosphoribosyltransferase [Chlamydiota bacterium]